MGLLIIALCGVAGIIYYEVKAKRGSSKSSFPSKGGKE